MSEPLGAALLTRSNRKAAGYDPNNIHMAVNHTKEMLLQIEAYFVTNLQKDHVYVYTGSHPAPRIAIEAMRFPGVIESTVQWYGYTFHWNPRICGAALTKKEAREFDEWVFMIVIPA